MALTPIKYGDKIVGLIHLGDWRKGFFTLEMVEILENIAGSIASALLRKRTETELALTHERYQLAVNGANDGIWDWDIQSNELFLSPRWEGHLGYRDDELENVFGTFENLLYAEDKPTVMDYVQR